MCWTRFFCRTQLPKIEPWTNKWIVSNRIFIKDNEHCCWCNFHLCVCVCGASAVCSEFWCETVNFRLEMIISFGCGRSLWIHIIISCEWLKILYNNILLIRWLLSFFRSIHLFIYKPKMNSAGKMMRAKVFLLKIFALQVECVLKHS